MSLKFKKRKKVRRKLLPRKSLRKSLGKRTMTMNSVLVISKVLLLVKKRKSLRKRLQRSRRNSASISS